MLLHKFQLNVRVTTVKINICQINTENRRQLAEKTDSHSCENIISHVVWKSVSASSYDAKVFITYWMELSYHFSKTSSFAVFNLFLTTASQWLEASKVHKVWDTNYTFSYVLEGYGVSYCTATALPRCLRHLVKPKCISWMNLLTVLTNICRRVDQQLYVLWLLLVIFVSDGEACFE